MVLVICKSWFISCVKAESICKYCKLRQQYKLWKILVHSGSTTYIRYGTQIGRQSLSTRPQDHVINVNIIHSTKVLSSPFRISISFKVTDRKGQFYKLTVGFWCHLDSKRKKWKNSSWNHSCMTKHVDLTNSLCCTCASHWWCLIRGILLKVTD